MGRSIALGVALVLGSQVSRSFASSFAIVRLRSATSETFRAVSFRVASGASISPSPEATGDPSVQLRLDLVSLFLQSRKQWHSLAPASGKRNSR